MPYFPPSTINNITGGTNTLFPTRADAIAAVIPSSVNSISTMGYYTPGDGGGAIYNRASSLSLYNPGFTNTSDSSVWTFVPQKPLRVKQFGWVGDGVTDNVEAMFNITAYAPSVAEPSQIFKNVTISVGNPCVIQPIPGSPPPIPHQLHADQLVRFSTTGTLPTGIVPGKLYYIQYGSVTPNTFEISETTGMFGGYVGSSSYTPTANYTVQYPKGAPVV